MYIFVHLCRCAEIFVKKWQVLQTGRVFSAPLKLEFHQLLLIHKLLIIKIRKAMQNVCERSLKLICNVMSDIKHESYNFLFICLSVTLEFCENA